MAKQPDDNALRKMADAAILLLVSRISAPLMVCLVGWVLHSVNEMQSSMASITATVTGKFETLTAKIEGVDKREANIEDWRNSMDAFADETKRAPSKSGTGL